MALNPKQEKFCVAYAKSGNARQSYLEAGYKCKPEAADASASQLLRNPKIQTRLAELHDKAADSSIADIREMQEVLTKIIRKEMHEEVLSFVGDEESEVKRVQKEPSLKDIINAIEKLGKMQGAFTTNLNVTAAIPVVISGADELED